MTTSRSPARGLALGAALLALSLRLPMALAQSPSPARRLTLADALAMARANAPTVKQAAARIATAEARIAMARAPRWPVMSGVASGNAFASQSAFVAQGFTVAQDQTWAWADVTANLRWTLFDFGKTTDDIRGAEMGTEGAKDDLHVSQQMAMAQAAVAYFTGLADADLVAAARESVAQRERSLAIARGLVSAGVRNPLDAVRSEAALEAARSDLAIARAAADDDGVSLAAALMLPADAAVALERPPEPPLDDDPHAVAEAAIAARPELAGARARVVQAQFDLDAARGGRLPTLGVNASAGLRYSYTVQGTTLGGRPSEMAQGSLSLTVPILDAATTARVRAAEASLSVAQSDLGERAATVRYQAMRAAIALRSARAVLAQSQQQATVAAANLAGVDDRHRHGLAGPLDLVDAQREDSSARALVVRAHLAADLARVRLAAAGGKLDALARR